MESSAVCVLLAMIILAAVSQAASDDSSSSTSIDDCPDNLSRDAYLQAHSGYCYEFHVTGKKEWTDARDECKDNGGSLVMPKTAAIQDYIYQELSTTYAYGSKVWIGLDDREHEDEYMWVDGNELESVDYSNWADDQGPDHGDHDFDHYTDDCAALKMSDSGKWHDYTCQDGISGDRHYAFVCQYLAVASD